MTDLNQDIQTYDMMERYAKGESLSDLAAECEVAEPVLRNRMRNYDPAKYKEAKGEAAQARITMRHAEHQYILSKNRENLLKVMHDSPEDINAKQMCQIEKTFGDRVALTEGDVTDRQEQIGKVTQIVTFASLPKEEPCEESP